MLLVLALQIQYYYVGISDESYIRIYKGILWTSFATIIINTTIKELE